MPGGERQVSTTDHHDPDRRPAAAGDDGTHRRARGGGAQHGFLRPQRQAHGVARDPRAGAGGRRGARLPTAPIRARTGERCLAHDRALPSVAAVGAHPRPADVRRRRNQETSASDYALLLSTSPADPDGIVRLVETGRADGVILMETLAHDTPHRASEGERPAVHDHRPNGGHERHQLRRSRLRRRSREEPRAPPRPRPSLRRALQLPAGSARRRLQLGADRPRRIRAGSRRPRRPRDPPALPAPGARGVRRGDRAAAIRERSAPPRSPPAGSSPDCSAPCARQTCTSPTTSPSSR